MNCRSIGAELAGAAPSGERAGHLVDVGGQHRGRPLLDRAPVVTELLLQFAQRNSRVVQPPHQHFALNHLRVRPDTLQKGNRDVDLVGLAAPTVKNGDIRGGRLVAGKYGL